jgi:leucyl aminopeptidase
MPVVSISARVPKSATAVDVPVTTEGVAKLPDGKKKAARLHGFEGKTGQTLVLAADDGTVEVLVGVGPTEELSADKIRRAAAAYAKAVSRHQNVACTLLSQTADLDRDDVVAAIIEGLRLASYRYNELRSDASRKKNTVQLKRVAIVGTGRGLRALVDEANAVVDAVELTRDLVNQPGGSLTPEAFVAEAKKAAADSGIKITVWTKSRIKRERLGGLLAVNQGSEHPPQLVRLSYRPAKGRPRGKVALVGKGVTFDSGGLSLKNSVGMMTMKIDMSGAAAVLATMCALPAVKAPVEVEAFIPLTDNMTGPDAQRPGDVFTARNGKTVEVLNTDAEGRLILADALSLAAESDADAVVEISTLTGSATAALGTGYAALMATDDDLAARLSDASARTSEKIWRLPLPPEYRSQLDSTVADLRNIGTTPYGGALIAGLFLKEFVGDKPFAHIDVGLSVYSETNKGINVKGATGFGTRLLIDVLKHWD